MWPYIVSRLLVTALALWLTGPVKAAEVWQRVPAPAIMPSAVVSGFAPVNDISLYYAIYGKDDSPPVLLIHGGLGHADLWASQIRSLSPDFRVIVADTRGHGRSTHDGRAYSYRLLAEDYIGLLDYLQIDVVHLVGWSDGANIGYELSQFAPERLASHFAFAGNVTVDAIQPTVQDNAVFASYVSMMATDYNRLSDGKIPFGNFVGALMTLWSTEKPGGLAGLRSVSVPTFVVHAVHDEAIKFDHALDIRLAIQPSGLIVMGGASHFAPLQIPDRFTELIRLPLAKKRG